MKSIRTQILGLIAIVAAGALVALGCALLAMTRIDTMNHRSSQQNHIALAAERLNAAVNLVVADSYLVYTARNPHFAGIASKAQPSATKAPAATIAISPRIWVLM
ncbi:MAG: hypothetical protein EOP19_10730, partial [Hyphomicrobiales bacterium]